MNSQTFCSEAVINQELLQPAAIGISSIRGS